MNIEADKIIGIKFDEEVSELLFRVNETALYRE